MFNFKSIYFVIFTLILCKCEATISDKRLCANENCSELVSVGITLIKYASPEEHVLSFAPNQPVNIYSHGAGTRPELVGVEINGKRGYINKNHVRETRLLKRPKVLVDTELVAGRPKEVLEGVPEIKADPTQQPYEIVDGTKIPLDVASSSTEAPVVISQSSTESTQPLNTVPENQNDKPVMPDEQKALNIEENANVKNQQGPQQGKDVDIPKDDENPDEEEDDTEEIDVDDDESEDDDEEDEPEIKSNEAPSKDTIQNASGNNPSIETPIVGNDSLVNDSGKEYIPNTGASEIKTEQIIPIASQVSEKGKENVPLPEMVVTTPAPPHLPMVSILGTMRKPDREDLANQPPEIVNIENPYRDDLASQPPEKVNIEKPDGEGLAYLPPEKVNIEKPVGDGLGHLPPEKVNIEKPGSLANLPPEEASIITPEVVIENVSINTENKLPAQTVNAKEEVKEQNLPQESSSLPPLGLEIPSPLILDVVTPNPLNNQNTIVNNLLEENKDTIENNLNPSNTLPSDLMPEFKDPEEGADIKVEENAGGGFVGGLGGMLSMFNSGEDREITEDASPPAQNEIKASVENEENMEGINSENTFLQNDLPHSVNSEDPVRNKVEDIISESAFSQNGLPQSVNLEDPLQNKVVSEDVPIASNPEVVLPPEVLSSDKTNEATSTDSENQEQAEPSPGIFENMMSFWSGTGGEETAKNNEDIKVESEESVKTSEENEEIITEDPLLAASNLFDPKPQEVNKQQDPNENVPSSWSFSNPDVKKDVCDKESKDCPQQQSDNIDAQTEKVTLSNSLGAEDLQFLFVEAISSDLFLYLSTTAVSVILLVFGMVLLDKCRREAPLIARINKLEQQLLTTMKENEMLQEKTTSIVEEKTQLVVEAVPNEVVEELNQKLAEMNLAKLALEEQVQALEKELDTSTEVGIELNKIITEMLNSTDGSEIIRENIEQMQKKLLEQQDSLNVANEALNLKETENHELRLEMEICNKKVIDLQSELDKMVEKILKIEEERDQQHSTLENEILTYQTQYKEAVSKEQTLNSEIQVLKQQVAKLQRLTEVKVKEYNMLKESMSELKLAKNNKDALKSLLEVSEVRAELEQLKVENSKYSEQLVQEREAKAAYGAKIESLVQELNELREKYQKADKEKVEIDTKLQVLNNYFKEKEDQMQKEISKYESLWAVKKGEATSTTERIRHMQEELQNYKSQNESLKQEIMNQEVELKSQISMLEKKAHESWVASRQTERKLEEARQEAAQLRNRLTMRERAIAEGNSQARMQSPLHQNGDLPISPPPLDPTQSPPPLFNPRDHMTKSPPMPGMPPPPFLPPPLGATPFIPPPPLDGMMPPMGDMGGMPPPFIPHLPPGMFPGDHRPPPLGRMSSPPPVGGRYTPESTVYSDYDRYSRRSPSPPYDSEYGASPPPIRGYSPYQDRLRDDRREYKRPQLRSNGRNSKGVHSSGSENDSLGKINKKPQRNV